MCQDSSQLDEDSLMTMSEICVSPSRSTQKISNISGSSNCNILGLHEELIRQLFSSLPNLQDTVRLACVAPKFRYAFNGWARRKEHTLNAEDVEEMQLPDIINLFRVAGPFIKVLLINCASFQKESLIVEFIAEYCKNLEEINYRNVTDDFHYRSLLSRLTRLKRVSIDCMDVEDVLSFDLMNNPDLESFELINGCYTGTLCIC